MKEIFDILKECCPMVDFESEEHLWSNKVIDSMDMVNIIAALEDKYDISIEYEMINPDNFDSVKKITELVHKLQ